jgi:phosphoglycolate phosphatase-like HAD superfamily hydrolase
VPTHLPKAILLDFDGVILESVHVKTDVFRYLFRMYPQHVEAIVEHHKNHTGVSRFHKFDYIYREILGQRLSSKLRQTLGREFSRHVFHRVLRCRFVTGAQSFLHKHSRRVPLFVISATPAAELRRIIRRRGIMPYFKTIYGHPVTKTEAIQKILMRARLSPKDVLMVGDARADWEAAKNHGIRFIGRIAPGITIPFPASITRVNDLAELDKVIQNT